MTATTARPSAFAELAEARGSTLEELAEGAGLRLDTVYRAWRGRRPGSEAAQRLAEVLAVAPSDVLDPEAWLARQRVGGSPARAAWLDTALTVTATGSPDWQDEAPCRNTDPEMFWPNVGEYPAEALALCRRCPVLGDCRELFFAGPGPDVGGVWFGTTHGERRGHRREQRRSAA